MKIGYGRYNTYMFNILSGGRSGERLFYNFSASYKKSESWRKWNRFESLKNTVKLGFYPDPRSLLETTISFSKVDLQLPGYLTESEFEQDPSQQTSSPWRKSGRYSRILFWSGKYERDISPSMNLRSLIYLQRWTHYHPVTARVVTGGSYVAGMDSQIELKHRLLGMNSLLLAGVQLRYDHYNSERYAYKFCRLRDGSYNLCIQASRTNPIDHVISDEGGAVADSQRNRNLMWGVFLQETLNPSERLILDLGIRFDQVVFDLKKRTYLNFAWGRNYYYSDPEFIQKKRTFNAVSPRLGAVFKLSSNLSLYGSISTGFQTPQDNEILTNPDLKHSRLTNYEVGLKGFGGSRFSFSTALFYTDVRNEIVSRGHQTEGGHNNVGSLLR